MNARLRTSELHPLVPGATCAFTHSGLRFRPHCGKCRNSPAQVAQTFGDGTVETKKATALYAGTTNESGHPLDQFCYANRGECVWVIGKDNPAEEHGHEKDGDQQSCTYQKVPSRVPVGYRQNNWFPTLWQFEPFEPNV